MSPRRAKQPTLHNHTHEGTMPCYFPDGSESNDLPCNSLAPVSGCCNTKSVCLSNGYCLSQHGKFAVSRASCTDRNWGEGCPKYCKDVNPQRLTALFLAEQGGVHKPNLFCCDLPPKANGLCQAPTIDVQSSPFSIPDGFVVYNRSTGDTVSSMPGSPDPEAGQGPAPVLVPKPSSSSTPIEIGIGVSLGVLLLLFIALFTWQFVRGRKLSKRIRELEKEPLVGCHQKSQQGSRAPSTSSYSQSRSRSISSVHLNCRSQSYSNSQSQNELGIQSPHPVYHYSRHNFANTPFLVENTKPRPELDPAFTYVEMLHTDRQELPT